MDNHASSSHSQPKKPTAAISAPKGPSSTSDKKGQDIWVEENAETLLKKIRNWERAEDEVSTGSLKRNVDVVKEGTDKDLRYYLGLIYEEYGARLAMGYEGYDGLAGHWITGWDKDVENRFVRRTMMCTLMRWGQSLAWDRLDAEINSFWTFLGADRYFRRTAILADADKGKGKGKHEEEGEEKSEEENEKEEEDEEIQRGYAEEYRENQREYEENEEEYEGKNEENDQDKADWVDVSNGGIDEDDWTTLTTPCSLDVCF